MESPLKIFGHPLHPVLIVFPLGLLSVGLLFDLVYQLTGNELFAQVAFWNIGVGILGGAAAAVFGLIDWLAIPDGTRARRLGLVHGGGNAVVLLLFAWSWLLRLNNVAYADMLPFLLGVAGVGIALVTAWIGGELVYRLRVGVDEGAHLDATNSLEGGIVSSGSRGGSAGVSG